ncbi:MAG: hypothetical protein ACH34Y_08150 [Brachymonas sp.]
MSTVLLAGLSDHDAAAIEILISMNWRDKRCVLLKRTADFSLPVQSAAAAACAKVVLDLGGVGLPQYGSEQAQALLAFLAGRPALLLSRTGGEAWPQAALPVQAGQRLEFLAAPYNSAAVKAALTALDVAPALAAALAPRPTLEPRPAAALPASSAVKSKLLAHGVSKSSKGAQTSPVLALREYLPALHRKRFLRLVEKMAGSEAQLLHIGATQLLLQPQEGWVAAHMPVSALLKVLANAAQLDAASLEPLAAAAAAQAQQALTAGRGQRYMLALDVVLWELCRHALDGVVLQAQGDAVLKLSRFPNFTQLGQVGAVDVQLAALCVRGEQSVRKLCEIFEGQEEEVLHFVALSVLSGLGQLQAPAPSKSGSNSRFGALGPSAPERPPTRGHKERRSFLRSLLDKLF